MTARSREDLEEIGVAIADPHSLLPSDEERAAFLADWRRARESEAALLKALADLRVAAHDYDQLTLRHDKRFAVLVEMIDAATEGR